MSLTQLVGIGAVAEKIKPFRPKLPRKIDGAVKVAPKTNHHSLVGTAFDYLLRFEIKRRVPDAIENSWVAEHATPQTIEPKNGVTVNMSPIVPDGSVHGSAEFGDIAEEIVRNARVAIDEHNRNPSPSSQDNWRLATHAIRLAKLDAFYRAKYMYVEYASVDVDAVDDLVNLLSIVPFNQLLQGGQTFLNPTFGGSSEMVGGADADLISGDMLFDVKTTKKSSMAVNQLDQLLGYFLLVRNERRSSERFPMINRAGFYFARHGLVWSFPTTMWTERQDFADMETWFVEYAKEWNAK